MGIYYLEKYDELSELGAFGQKLRHFTNQNEPKKRTNENNFEVFSISEMNVTKARAEKVYEKMGSFV